ncbi:MFS transporter [Paenirhodobacter enshiensis]|uniref:MFS transporter n=1 Tax=Paenirhodobacter enshiensis TaxID=1105367 RepID=UPI00068E0136|nr:MFS transporter [Paenirhodobacter enshiensis]
MLTVLRTSWPLLLGIVLLMLGNGIQGPLLSYRGGAEGFGTFEMSFVMSGYYVGFLLGSQLVPTMIRRVGHVRVFAALGAMVAAVMVGYAVLPNWIAWSAMRVLIGFSFSGVYITAESWFNASNSNEMRGQALSAYMIAQMIGIIASQALMNVASPEGFMLFALSSILVSLSFTPILLSAQPAPAFSEVKRLNFINLYRLSPLSVISMLLLGGVFSALFGMAGVWGNQAGLSVREVSIFIGAMYVGGLIAQYPIGWISDRMDRRRITAVVSGIGALAMVVAFAVQPGFVWLSILAAIAGGVANPLYSLLIAYLNDYLDRDDMAAGSAGLLFVNGVGAFVGPFITGWLMSFVGPWGFFLYLALMFGAIAAYAAYRIWLLPNRAGAYPNSFAVISPSASALAVGGALDAKAEGAGDALSQSSAPSLAQSAPPSAVGAQDASPKDGAPKA